MRCLTSWLSALSCLWAGLRKGSSWLSSSALAGTRRSSRRYENPLWRATRGGTCRPQSYRQTRSDGLRILPHWIFDLMVASLYSFISPGGHDSAFPALPHRAHACAVGAPPLSAARQGLHPLVALPAVPALRARPPPGSADLRGLPGALLPQGRFQGKRTVRHLRVQHAVPGDGALAGWAGVRPEEQRLLVHAVSSSVGRREDEVNETAGGPGGPGSVLQVAKVRLDLLMSAWHKALRTVGRRGTRVDPAEKRNQRFGDVKLRLRYHLGFMGLTKNAWVVIWKLVRDICCFLVASFQ